MTIVSLSVALVAGALAQAELPPPVEAAPNAPSPQAAAWKGLVLGDWTLKPEGNVRARVAGAPERDFTGIRTGRTWVSLVQTQLGLKASVRSLALAVEVHDGREFLSAEEGRNQVFPLDLHQLFAQYALALPDGEVRMRAGRQVIAFGSARLLTPMRWSNLQPTYDGARLNLELGRLRADAFAARPVVKRAEGWDLGSLAYVPGEYLWGVVGTRPLLPWLAAEAYLLGLLHTRGTAAIEEGHRVTPGVRLFGKLAPLPFGYEVEAAYQLGKVGERSIRAHALHAEITCACPGPLAPMVRLEGNLASGDADRTDAVAKTFVPLFGKGHRPYGPMDLFWWQNMRELALSVTLSPHRTVKISPEYHLFWLDQAADDWTFVTGRPLRQVARPAQGELAAQELDLVVIWTPSTHVQLEVAAGFIPDPGRISPAGATGNAWRTYAQTVVQF